VFLFQLKTDAVILRIDQVRETVSQTHHEEDHSVESERHSWIALFYLY